MDFRFRLFSLLFSGLILLLSSLLCSTHTIDWLVNLARREPECLLGESAKVRRHSGSRRGGAAGGGALREERRMVNDNYKPA